MMIKNLTIIIICLFLLTGCATIMHGDSQYVEINSNPQGATAYTEGNYFITPAKVLLKRSYPMHEYTVLFQKEGYKPGYGKIEQRPSPWLWGNIIWGIFPGLAVDMITGGAADLYPTQITVTLEPSAK